MKPLSIKVKALDDADFSEIADMTLRLRNELLELEDTVDNVSVAPGGDLPEGAKALSTMDWSTLLVTMAGASGGAFVFLTYLSGWLGRNQSNEISMTLPNGAMLSIKGDITKRGDFDQFVDLVSRSFAASPTATPRDLTGTEALVTLREKMISFLTLEDIQSICFDMGIDYEMLAGETKGGKVRSLLLIAHPHRIETVRVRCHSQNSSINWHDSSRAL